MEEILRAAAAGDERALRALREVGRWLGIGVAGIVNTFNPRRVVLGGYFARIHHHVESQIETALDARALPASRASVEVVASQLGWEAPLARGRRARAGPAAGRSRRCSPLAPVGMSAPVGVEVGPARSNQ